MGKIVGRTFAQPSALETPAQRYLCDVCGKEYKTERGLAEHLKKEHPLDILPEEGIGPAEANT